MGGSRGRMGERERSAISHKAAHSCTYMYLLILCVGVFGVNGTADVEWPSNSCLSKQCMDRRNQSKQHTNYFH